MNTSTSTPSRYAWTVVALLFPVALLNYLDRQIFSVMKKSIIAGVPDIGTDARFGELMAIFLLVYGLLSPVGGLIADRFNRRWVIIGSLAVWSAITWLTGHAQTFEQMWWARALMGVSEACYIPAGLALIADYHPGGTRSRAIGVHQAGIYAGLILGGMGGYIADSSYGWRAGFMWFGAAGVLYALVLLVFLKGKAVTTEEAARRGSIAGSLKELFGIGAFLLLLVYFTLPGMPGWIVKSWMPALLAEKFQLTQGKAGMAAVMWVTLASLGGALLGGFIADQWMKTTERGRIYTSAIGMVLMIPALFGVGYATSLTMAIASLILFGLGWGFFDTNNMPILCQLTRPELRATAYGLMNMFSITLGGWAVKRLGALKDQGVEQSVIFTVCAIAAAISVVIVLLIRPKPASP